VVAVLVLASGLALGSGTAAAQDRPLPADVPAGSVLAPATTKVFEHRWSKVDPFSGVVSGFCSAQAYTIIPRAWATSISTQGGEDYARFYREGTIVNPRTGERTQRGQAFSLTTKPTTNWYGTNVLVDYTPDGPNLIDPGEDFAYFSPNYDEYASGRFDLETSACGPSARAERAERLRGLAADDIWWTNGPIDNQPPVASFTWKVSDTNPLEVAFTNTSTDPESTLADLTHSWSFSQGSGSLRQDPVHEYTEAGEYAVSLTVTDSMGLTNRTTQTVRVGGSPLDGALFPFPTGDSVMKEDERLGVRLRVENDGDGPLSNVAVTSIRTTPIDPAAAGEIAIAPKVGGETLSGSLGTGGDRLDFADYEVLAKVAGEVRVDVVVEADLPDGEPTSALISWEVEVRPAPLKVELEVSYAEPPGGATEPPGFQKDNNGDGEVDARDHRVEIEVTATNAGDETLAAVEVNDVAEPVDFDDRYLGGGQVFLDPIELPAQTRFGDLDPGESETLTFAYEAKEPVWADATSILRGRVGDEDGPLVTGFGQAEVKLDTDLALEAWMDLEERPYEAGQVVRLNGQIENLLEDVTLPDGTVEEAKSLAVILDPIVEENASNGYPITADFGGRTPQGTTPFVLEPGETLDIRAIVPTARTKDPSNAGIRYLVRAWELDDEQPDELGVEIDQSRIIIDEDDGRGTEFSTPLQPVSLEPDELEECETEIFDAVVTCNLWVGLREFGTGLAQLGPVIVQGSEDFVRAGFAIRAWAFELWLDSAKAVLGDEQAMQRLITEVEVQMETFVAARIIGGEALDAVGDSVVEFFDEAKETLQTGDTNAIVAWTSRYLGENPDLGLTAIAKVRAARALFGTALPSGSQSQATSALVEAADDAAAANKATLEARVEAAIAKGENPATNGTFVGDEVVTNVPRVFRGIYGARKTELNKMLELARAEDVLIAFRARSPRAADLIRDALARQKPMDVKTKGVNEIDINYFGYRREAKDLVELVEPPIDWRLTKKGREAELEAALDEHMAKLKERHAEIGADPVWEAEVRSRLETRTKEWAKEVPNFRRYKTEGINVEFGYAEQGLPASLDDHVAEIRKAQVRTGTIVDPITGKERLYMSLEMADAKGENFLPITGDIDIVAILNGDRSPLTDITKRTRIYRNLARLVGMQHGDSFSWVNGEGQIRFLREHLAGKEGAEALVVAGSDGQARMGYFEERLSTVADASGNEVSKTTFHMVTGAPRKLVTDPAGGVPITLPGPLDLLEAFTLDPVFYLPGNLERFMRGLEETELVPAEFDPSAPAIQPDGEGGANAYLPGSGDDAAPAAVGRSARALVDEDDPVEAAAAEVAGEGFGPLARPEVGAQGGRWVPFDAAAAAAATPTGRFPRGVMSAIDGAVPAGSKVLPVSGLDVLGMAEGSPWFEVGDTVVVDPGGLGEERHVVASVSPLTTVAPLANDHLHATGVVLVARAQVDPEPTTTTTAPPTSAPSTTTPVDPTAPDPADPSTPTTAPGGGTGSGGGGTGSASADPGVGRGELPRTGTTAMDLLPLALALVLGGGMVLVARSRTRSRRLALR
jgi:PKD repeat protein